jgi:hypothetical protein
MGCAWAGEVRDQGPRPPAAHVTGLLVLSLALQLGAAPTPPPPMFCLRVDSARREVIVSAGPVHVAAEDHMHEAPPNAMGASEQQGEVFVQRFAWPTTTWVRGYRLRLFDARGRPLPRGWIHHLYVVDFDRRELVYPIAQRLLGLGQETPDVTLSSTVGIPLPAGHELGLYLMWHNDSGADLDGVSLELAFPLAVAKQGSPPLEVFPFFVDAHVALGADWTFAIPPGGDSAAYEFTLPISGHLRIAGGHLHDHGVALRLEDATTGEIVVTLPAERDSTGRLLRIPYRVFARRDNGPHLLAGREYRLVAIYDNPTTHTISGLMGTLAGLFAPDDPRRWPPIDPEDPTFTLDGDLLTTSHPGGGPQARACAR